jgi:membrane protein
VAGNREVHDCVVAQVKAAVGPESAHSIGELMSTVSLSLSSKAASSVGVVLLLLGASGVVGELRSSLSQIWKVSPREGMLVVHLKTQLISIVFVLAAGLLLIASLFLSALAATLETYLAGKTAIPPFVLQSVNMAGSFALITLLFAMIYKYLPGPRIPWHDVWMGASATSLLLSVGNSFLGLYLGKLSGASAYGAAGAVVLILVWTYYCAQIMYLGAEFTHVYAETRGARK